MKYNRHKRHPLQHCMLLLGLLLLQIDWIQAQNYDNCTFEAHPIFSVWGLPDTICAGEVVPFSIGYDNSNEIVLTPKPLPLPSTPDTVFLGDGTLCGDSCYTRSYINFPSSYTGSINYANDIEYVRLKIEHSYADELYIRLFCPNGNNATILYSNFYTESGCGTLIPSGSQWQAGNNVDDGPHFGIYNNNDGDDNCNPALNQQGTGWNYCWSSSTNHANAGYIYRYGNTDNYGRFLPTDIETLSPLYRPDETFSSLINCPIAGTWYIEIVDGSPDFNGYLFDWEIVFDENVLTTSFGRVDSAAVLEEVGNDWLNDNHFAHYGSDTTFRFIAPSNITNDTTINRRLRLFNPYSSPDPCYYDTTFSITILAPKDTNIFASICEGGAPYSFNGRDYNNDLDTLISLPGQASNGCDSIIHLHITKFDTPTISINANPTPPICEGEEITLTAVSDNCNVRILSQSFSALRTLSYCRNSGDCCDNYNPSRPNCYPPCSTALSQEDCNSLFYISTCQNIYPADYNIKLGTNNYTTLENSRGSFTTKPLNLSNPFKLSILAKGWGQEMGKFIVSVDGIPQQTFTTINNPIWGSGGYNRSITLYFPAATDHSTITIQTDTINANGQISGYKAFINKIEVYSLCDQYIWSPGEHDNNAELTIQPEDNTEYTVTVTNGGVCSASATYFVTVNHPHGTSETLTECGSYTWHGTEHTESGTYYYSHQDANGCTQVDTLHLTIIPITTNSTIITICEGDSVTLTADCFSEDEPIFTEGFSSVITGDDNDGSGSSTKLQDNEVPKFPECDEDHVFRAGGHLRFGDVSSGGGGYITSIPIDLSQPYIVKMWMRGWNNPNEHPWFFLKVDGITKMQQSIPVSAWSAPYTEYDYSSISGATANSRITIGNTDLHQRFFLDSVAVISRTECQYVWNTGESTANITVIPSTTTTYHVTVTPSGECPRIDTFHVVVRTKPVITFNPCAGSCDTTSMQMDCQQGIILPAATPCATDYVFAGWSTSPLSSIASTEPNPLYLQGEYFYTTTSETLYAVYKKCNSYDTVFRKITAPRSDWSGEYLIASTTGNTIFNGALASNILASNNNYSSITINNNTVLPANNPNINLTSSTFIISSVNNYYSIKSKSGYFIGKTTSSNGIETSSTTPFNNTITYSNNSNHDIIISSNGLDLKTGLSTGVIYKYYTSGTKYPIQLFRLEIDEICDYTSFPAYTPATVHFEPGNGIYNGTDITEENCLAGIELPEAIPCASDYHFVGWTSSAITGSTSTAPSPLLAAGEHYDPTSHDTLYAVYKKCNTSDTLFTKVTASRSDWSGEYLIASTTGNTIFNGALASNILASNNNYSSITINNNTVLPANNPNINLTSSTFIISSVNNYYSIKSKSGYFIGKTTSSNGIETSSTTPFNNTITYSNNSNHDIIISSNGLDLKTALPTGVIYKYYTSGTKYPIQLFRLEIDEDCEYTTYPYPSRDINAIACNSYTWHEHTYTESGEYKDTITNAVGCDSILTLHLTIKDTVIKHIYDVVCLNSPYSDYNFNIPASETGTAGNVIEESHTDTGHNGCDSTTVLHLTVTSVSDLIITATTDTICAGESDTLWVMREIQVNPSVGDILCTDNSFVKLDDWPAAAAAGKVAQGIVYYLHPDGSGGWVVALHDAATNCKWGEYGDVTDLINYANNDSGIQQALTDTAAYTNTLIIRNYQTNYLYPLEYAARKVNIEQGWVLPTLKQLGKLYVTLPSISSAITAVGGDNLYSNYSDRAHYWTCIENSTDRAFGILFTNGAPFTRDKTDYLAVRAIRSFSNPELVCDSSLTYRWSTGSTQPYLIVSPNITTTYTVTGTDTNGCSGTAELTVVVKNKTYGIDIQEVCDSLTWIDGITYTESTNTPTFTLTNADGCDSVVTLHLTVKKSSGSDTTVITCGAFEWHGQTYTESGNYKDTLTNAAGCDSIITLHLSITEVNISINASADTICTGEVDTLWIERVSSIAIGDILCTDNSFVKPVDWEDATAMGKVALGIVFYVDNTGEHGWAVHLHNSTSPKRWTLSPYNTDIHPLFNYPNAREAIKDLDGYTNTQRIRSASNATPYPADIYPAVYAVDFEHGWYLPAAGQLRLLFAERHTINASLEAVSHTQQGVTPIADTFQYWSSTECNRDEAWGVTNSLGWVRNTSKNEYNRTCSVRNF